MLGTPDEVFPEPEEMVAATGADLTPEAAEAEGVTDPDALLEVPASELSPDVELVDNPEA